MATIHKTITILLLFALYSCNGAAQTHDYAPLIPKDTTYANERNNTLFAFVGEKLNVHLDSAACTDFDNAFAARYKVLQRIYGYYSGDTISFMVYDHYGVPAFSAYNHVLLYLSEHDGKYYHEKYQYDVVNKTIDGQWAGAPKDYPNPNIKDTTLKPVMITYESMPAAKGFYVKDLFRCKKEGVLTARELFGDGRSTTVGVQVQDVDLAHVKAYRYKESKAFKQFKQYWKKLALSIQQGDTNAIKRILPDTIITRKRIKIPAQTFMNTACKELYDATTTKMFKQKKAVILKESDVETEYNQPVYPNTITNNGIFKMYNVAIVKQDDDAAEDKIYLTFVETTKGYLLGYFSHIIRKRQ